MEKLPLIKEIAAIIPHYDNSADYTVIITNIGEEIHYTCHLRTLLKHIAYELCVDLTAIKKHAAKATQQAILHPLPLSPAILLVPLKVRIPCLPGLPSIGYVNIYSIKNILESNTSVHTLPYRSYIQLCGGNKLPVIWTSATIKKQLRYARLSVSELPGAPASLPSHKNRPAGPELRPLAQKLIELMYDILLLKEN